MASKNTDIIEQLADTIVANLTTPIAKRGKETAPNDKTFSSVIIGINQKFTDNVSEDEQSEIIEKFSIPETVEEGEDNYYTFKINGVYYCKSQNGDFKLYDKIMVYIPNGNWSDMYFDYADGASHNSGGGGGSDTELPDYIVSPDMPGGDDCNIGDLWIVTNDEAITEFTNLTEDTFVNMYEYKADENEVVDWRLVKARIAETSSKVDKNTDNYWIVTDVNGKFVKIDMWETSGSTTSFYEIYPNPERETAPNVSIYDYSPLKLGDYWYEIDSDVNKNLEARWIYSFNPETNRNEYKNEYNIQSGSGGSNFYISVIEPKQPQDNDLLAILSNDGSQVMKLYQISNRELIELQFTQGTDTPSPPTKPDYEKWYCYFPDGQLRVVIGWNGTTFVTALANDGNVASSPVFFRNEIVYIDDGDLWVQINNAVEKKATALYRYETDEWIKKAEFGTASAIEIGNGLQYQNGKLTLKLGDGLEFDNNGAVKMAYAPIVNVEHAILVKKEGTE